MDHQIISREGALHDIAFFIYWMFWCRTYLNNGLVTNQCTAWKFELRIEGGNRNFAIWGENENFHFLQFQCAQMPNEKLKWKWQCSHFSDFWSFFAICVHCIMLISWNANSKSQTGEAWHIAMHCRNDPLLQMSNKLEANLEIVPGIKSLIILRIVGGRETLLAISVLDIHDKYAICKKARRIFWYFSNISPTNKSPVVSQLFFSMQCHRSWK